MKKFLYLFAFFIFFSLLDFSVAKNNDKNISLKNFIKSNKLKTIDKNYENTSYIDKRFFRTDNDLFKIPSKFNTFLKEFVVSIEKENSDDVENGLSATINSNIQKQIGTKLIAEGNVVIRSRNGILKSTKFTYDQKYKYMLIEGDIYFRTKSHYLTASKIEYDFINKKGFIENAFGSVNFKKISEFTNLDEKNDLRENFEEDLKINNINLESSSKLEYTTELFNNQRRFTDQTIKAEINPINRSRFVSKKIEINNNTWYAKELRLTNDPFSYPQLIINNKDFKLFDKNDETRIKTKWSSLTFENKLTVPIGPRNLNLDREYSRWGLGYDKNKYDGIYLYRNFNPINLYKKNNTQINLITKFNIQRAIEGKTKSFSAKEEPVLANKIEQDAKFLDFLGIDSVLTSSFGQWDYILKAETNSIDLDKIDKIVEGETYLSKNIHTKKQDNYSKTDDISLFGIYRKKAKNGSLGEILVNSAYGATYDLKKINLNSNVTTENDISIGYGRYESASTKDHNSLLANDRLNLSLKQKKEYSIWKPRSTETLTKEYKYTPNIINQGLYWVIEGNLDFFRYEDGSKQDLFLIKTGPKLILGEFKNNFFDYTELSIYPRFKFNDGKSPFLFDQVVDTKVIEIGLKQRIYKPFALKFSGEINLEDNISDDEKLINPTIELSWNRRAYNVSLNYNFDTEIGGLFFNIYSFDFNGLGDKF